jgi:hypothetical protein
MFESEQSVSECSRFDLLFASVTVKVLEPVSVLAYSKQGGSR